MRHREKWLPVPGYEGFYSVSNMGSVRSERRRVPSGRGARIEPGAIKATRGMRSGHKSVTLNREGERATLLVHRLVLAAFVGPCPDGMECRHLDGDPTNNDVRNLRWGTRAQNAEDMGRHGTRRLGSARPGAKLSESDVVDIRRALSEGARQVDLASKYGVSRQTVSQVALGRRWGHVPEIMA